MEFEYDRKVEKYFENWGNCIKAIGSKDTKFLKRRMNQLESAEIFNDFLSLGIGDPHPLQNFEGIPICWSISITRNKRLILYFDEEDSADIRQAKRVHVKGVVDYHGQKNNWYIP